MMDQQQQEPNVQDLLHKLKKKDEAYCNLRSSVDVIVSQCEELNSALNAEKADKAELQEELLQCQEQLARTQEQLKQQIQQQSEHQEAWVQQKAAMQRELQKLSSEGLRDSAPDTSKQHAQGLDSQQDIEHVQALQRQVQQLQEELQNRHQEAAMAAKSVQDMQRRMESERELRANKEATSAKELAVLKQQLKEARQSSGTSTAELQKLKSELANCMEQLDHQKAKALNNSQKASALEDSLKIAEQQLIEAREKHEACELEVKRMKAKLKQQQAHYKQLLADQQQAPQAKLQQPSLVQQQLEQQNGGNADVQAMQAHLHSLTAIVAEMARAWQQQQQVQQQQQQSQMTMHMLSLDAALSALTNRLCPSNVTTIPQTQQPIDPLVRLQSTLHQLHQGQGLSTAHNNYQQQRSQPHVHRAPTTFHQQSLDHARPPSISPSNMPMEDGCQGSELPIVDRPDVDGSCAQAPMLPHASHVMLQQHTRHRHVGPNEATPDTSDLSASTSGSDHGHQEVVCGSHVPASQLQHPLSLPPVHITAVLPANKNSVPGGQESPDTVLQGCGSCNNGVFVHPATVRHATQKQQLHIHAAPNSSSGGSGAGPGLVDGRLITPSPTPSPPLVLQSSAMLDRRGLAPQQQIQQATGGRHVDTTGRAAAHNHAAVHVTVTGEADVQVEPPPAKKQRLDIDTSKVARQVSVLQSDSLPYFASQPKTRGRHLKPRTPSELLQPLMQIEVRKTPHGFVRHAASVVKTCGKNIAKAIMNGTCPAPAMTAGLLTAVLSCAAPLLEATPDEQPDQATNARRNSKGTKSAITSSVQLEEVTVVDKSAGCSKMPVALGPVGWGGWCNLEAWNLSKVMLLGQAAAAVELELQAHMQTAGLEHDNSLPGLGITGSFVPQLLRDWHKHILQVQTGSQHQQATPSNRTTLPSQQVEQLVQDSQRTDSHTTADRHVSDLSLELSERCALAHAFMAATRALGDRQAARGFLFDVLEAYLGSRDSSTGVPDLLPLLYASISAWPQCLLVTPNLASTPQPTSNASVWDPIGLTLGTAMVSSCLRAIERSDSTSFSQQHHTQHTRAKVAACTHQGYSMPSVDSSQASGRSSILTGGPVAADVLPALAHKLLRFLAALPCLQAVLGSGMQPQGLEAEWIAKGSTSIWQQSIEYLISVIRRAAESNQATPSPNSYLIGVQKLLDTAQAMLMFAAKHVHCAFILHVLLCPLLTLQHRLPRQQQAQVLRITASICEAQFVHAQNSLHPSKRLLTEAAINTLVEICSRLATVLQSSMEDRVGESLEGDGMSRAECIASILTCCVGILLTTTGIESVDNPGTLKCDLTEEMLKPRLQPALRVLKSWASQQQRINSTRVPPVIHSLLSGVVLHQ